MLRRSLAVLLLACAAGCSGRGRAAEPGFRPPPPPAPEKTAAAVYYSDLGPDELDISDYPPRLRQEYRIYSRTCSLCHGLSRSLNAPPTSRLWWRFYMQRMRTRARWGARPLSAEESEAVLDFLEYDDGARKRTREYEAWSAALRERFDALTAERMRRLQEGPQPRLIGK